MRPYVLIYTVHTVQIVSKLLPLSRPGKPQQYFDLIARQDSGYGKPIFFTQAIRFVTQEFSQRGKHTRQGAGRHGGRYTGDQSAKADKSGKEKAKAKSYEHGRSQ